MQKNRSDERTGPGDDASSEGLNHQEFNDDAKGCLQMPGDESDEKIEPLLSQ